MRLAVSKRGSYHADLYCSDSHSAKKVLNQHCISALAIDFYLRGREQGVDVIRWGIQRNSLPPCVVIIENDRNKRSELATALSKGGYSSADGTTFIKH